MRLSFTFLRGEKSVLRIPLFNFVSHIWLSSLHSRFRKIDCRLKFFVVFYFVLLKYEFGTLFILLCTFTVLICCFVLPFLHVSMHTNQKRNTTQQSPSATNTTNEWINDEIFHSYSSRRHLETIPSIHRFHLWLPRFNLLTETIWKIKWNKWANKQHESHAHDA